MDLPDADLKSRFARLLRRKNLPRRFADQPEALDDEIVALVRAAARAAPRTAEGIDAWWPLFEDALGEACGSIFPNEKEVRAAGEAASKFMPKLRNISGEVDMRPIAIAARKMGRGEDVSEDYLWGRCAVEMITQGLIAELTMTRYRNGAFLKRKQLYGEAMALAWEAEAKARHEDAKRVYRSRGAEAEPREVRLSYKSMALGVTEETAA